MSGQIIKGCLLTAMLAACCLLLLAGACLVSLFMPKSPQQAAADLLNLELPDGVQVVRDVYAEPSFPTGDGYTWTVLQIPAEQVANFKQTLRQSPNWKPLPLPPELAAGESVLQPRFMSGVDGEIPLKTAVGFYLFIDHQEEYNRAHGEKRYDTDQPFYERPSYNFLFAVFDEADGKLYIWSLDT